MTPEKYCKPADLAKHVHLYLSDKKKNNPRITMEILTELFEIMNYVSMKTEEGEMIQVNIVFCEPETQNTSPQADFSSHSWDFMRFEKPLLFNIKNLLKLSKAADPWSSSIAVYFDQSNKLYIHGMIDQAIHTQSYINHETTSQPDQAGYFQASIVGIGSLSVMYRFDVIATLRQNMLVTDFPDVLRYGPVAKEIKLKAKPQLSLLLSEIQKFYPELEEEEITENFITVWRSTIARLLIHIKKYHHGGAFLISNERNGLDIKYKLEYARLGRAIRKYVLSGAKEAQLANEIGKKQLINRELYANHYYMGADHLSAERELKGAIRFIASNSCVDGAILFNGVLAVQGFGTVIKKIKLPKKVFVARDTQARIDELESKDPKEFGTRHQSMISYCNEHPGTIGFVVSQDGDIRVIMKIDEKVVVWDNIRTQRIIKVAGGKKPSGIKYITKMISN